LRLVAVDGGAVPEAIDGIVGIEDEMTY